MKNTQKETESLETIRKWETLCDESLADAANWKAQALELREAARYAANILNLIPAFGDSIGDKVSKPQLAVALNKLSAALAKAEGVK
jgi:hypothetical protein